MPWTETTRGQNRRDHLRYASDLTDAEWAVIEPHMPERRALGRPHKTDLREIVNALLYIAATGCQWRMLPKGFPPRSTVQGYFYLWRADGGRARASIFSWRKSAELYLKAMARADGMIVDERSTPLTTEASSERR